MIDARATTPGGFTGIREALRFIKRHKIVIVAPVVLFAGIAWTFASTSVPRFSATSTLTLNVSKVRIVDNEVVSRLPLEASTIRSELDVMRSRSLNEEVAVKLGLLSDPTVQREAGAWLFPVQFAAHRIRDAFARFFPGFAGKIQLDPMPTITET